MWQQSISKAPENSDGDGLRIENRRGSSFIFLKEDKKTLLVHTFFKSPLALYSIYTYLFIIAKVLLTILSDSVINPYNFKSQCL